MEAQSLGYERKKASAPVASHLMARDLPEPCFSDPSSGIRVEGIGSMSDEGYNDRRLNDDI